MIVTCPACGRQYRVQAGILGNGRFVRCTMCGATWQQTPISEAEEGRRRVAHILKWTCFWFCVSLSIFSLLFAKDAVVRLWPSVSCLYDAVGCSTDKTQNAFEVCNISNFLVRKEGKLYMGLRGEIVNISGEVRSLSSITISLKEDPSVENKYNYKKLWNHNLSSMSVLPNQRVSFETELQSVPCCNLICDITLNAF